MARSTWNSDRFAKWQEETHIPEDVMKMVEMIAEKIGICIEEATIEHRNRGGYLYGFSKGFVLSHCTSSLEDGSSVNMTPVFMKWIKGLGFGVCGSYGDNGMDSATNWQDTWWYDEISYEPTMVDSDGFYDWYDTEDDW